MASCHAIRARGVDAAFDMDEVEDVDVDVNVDMLEGVDPACLLHNRAGFLSFFAGNFMHALHCDKIFN